METNWLKILETNKLSLVRTVDGWECGRIHSNGIIFWYTAATEGKGETIPEAIRNALKIIKQKEKK